MNSFDYISKNYYLKRYFENIPQEELKKYCRLITYKPQNIIVKKGEHINFIGIIISGRALLVNEFENGNAYILKELKLLSVIGDIEIVSSSKGSACTIESIDECVLIAIDDKIFINWMKKYHGFALRVAQRLAERFYESSNENGKYMVYNSNYSLVSTIINVTESIISTKEEKNFNIKLKNTRKELGERIGLNERTINRLLQKLKNENLISINSGKIYVNNIQLQKLKELKENLQMDRRKI
jgi:CRP-like cAMP-binding protein